MSLIARFEYGTYRFDLMDGRVTIGEGFSPPTTLVKRVLGQGQFEARVEAENVFSRAWGFMVHVDAGSETEARRVLERLQIFLQQAGNPRKPLYFAFRDWGSDFDFEPSWGQFGALTRLRVLQGTVEFGEMFEVVYDDGQLIGCPISLTIDALSYGLWQPLATAGGGVFEEWAGRNGESVGVRVASNPSGVENYFTNPVFGHSTWNTGWTAGSDLSVYQNTEEQFRLFGFSSARLVCKGVTNRTFTQNISVVNTNQYTMSCYAKQRTGGVIDSTILSLRYGATTLTTRYLALRDGWYFLYGLVTGIVGAQTCGVILEPWVDVYVDGFQLEEQTWPNPLVYGDLPGAAWGGTVHASATTGAGVGKLKLPAVRSQVRGSIQGAFQCMSRSADLANGTYYLFQDEGAKLAIYYDKTNGRWVCTDGTSVISQSFAVFNEGDVFVFHVTWSTSSFSFYINGGWVSTTGYTVPTSEAASIYLGSTNTMGSQGPWVLLGFDVYPAAMTAADVATFYGQAAAILFQAGTTTEDVLERISPVPWLWTRDGDNIVDNCDDATRDNWALVGGVGGGVEAETEWMLNALSLSSVTTYWLLQADFVYDKFHKPVEMWYLDLSGTADANASGGAYQAITADTTGVAAGGTSIGDAGVLAGGLDLFVRLKAASGQDVNLWGAVIAGIGGTGEIETDHRRVSLTTSYKWIYLGRVYFELPIHLEERFLTVAYKLWVQTLTGTLGVHVDYLMAVQRGFKMIYEWPVGIDAVVVDGEVGYGLLTGGNLSRVFETYGEAIRLRPGRLNLIWLAQQVQNSLVHTITHTATFAAVRCRPRWVLQ